MKKYPLLLKVILHKIGHSQLTPESQALIMKEMHAYAECDLVSRRTSTFGFWEAWQELGESLEEKLTHIDKRATRKTHGPFNTVRENCGPFEADRHDSISCSTDDSIDEAQVRAALAFLESVPFTKVSILDKAGTVVVDLGIRPAVGLEAVVWGNLDAVSDTEEDQQ